MSIRDSPTYNKRKSSCLNTSTGTTITTEGTLQLAGSVPSILKKSSTGKQLVSEAISFLPEKPLTDEGFPGKNDIIKKFIRLIVAHYCVRIFPNTSELYIQTPYLLPQQPINLLQISNLLFLLDDLFVLRPDCFPQLFWGCLLSPWHLGLKVAKEVMVEGFA